MARFDDSERDFPHGHDCAGDPNCNHDPGHAQPTIEGTVAHLVLSFSQLAFSQIDGELLVEDAEKQQLSFQFLYGAVKAFAETEGLSEAQLREITANVLLTLLPWDREDCVACAQDLMSLDDASGAVGAIDGGKAAMEDAMGAAHRLNQLLEAT